MQCIPVILPFWGWRQEDYHECEASLDYAMSSRSARVSEQDSFLIGAEEGHKICKHEWAF